MLSLIHRITLIQHLFAPHRYELFTQVTCTNSIDFPALISVNVSTSLPSYYTIARPSRIGRYRRKDHERAETNLAFGALAAFVGLGAFAGAFVALTSATATAFAFGLTASSDFEDFEVLEGFDGSASSLVFACLRFGDCGGSSASARFRLRGVGSAASSEVLAFGVSSTLVSVTLDGVAPHRSPAAMSHVHIGRLTDWEVLMWRLCTLSHLSVRCATMEGRAVTRFFTTSGPECVAEAILMDLRRE